MLGSAGKSFLLSRVGVPEPNQSTRWDLNRGYSSVNNSIIACLPKIMFIIFCDFLMVEQIFLSPQMKRSVIISNELVHTTSRTSC